MSRRERAGITAGISLFVFLFLPALVAWIGPTVVGTPLIAWWIRTWRRELERDSRTDNKAHQS